MRPVPTITAASVAVPPVPRPLPRHSGCTHTPWIWLTAGDWDPTSALKTTSPFSKRAHARPRAPTPVAAATVADPRVDTHLADEHVDCGHQVGVDLVVPHLAHTRVDVTRRHPTQRHQRLVLTHITGRAPGRLESLPHRHHQLGPPDQ